MSELRRVGGPPSRIDRHLGQILVIVLVAGLIAVVKPWGASTQPGSLAIVASSPSPSPRLSPSPTKAAGPLQYDILDFGIREPPPEWEIWSAGTFASFQFAMRADIPTQAAASSPAASSTAVSVGSTSDIPVDWPIVQIPPGSQFVLIAINRPLGHTIEVDGLTRDDQGGGALTVLHPVTGVSPWPSHFTTVGLGDGADSTAMQPWPAGTYHLALTIGPGRTTRSLEIIVEKTRASAPPGSTPSTAAPAADPS